MTPISSLIPVSEVDESILSEVVRRILASVLPEKIILFGLYARGDSHQDSDLGVLVVMRSELPRYKHLMPINMALAGILIPKDVVVYTPEEVSDVEFSS